MRRFVGRTLKPQILCEKKIAWSFLVTFFGMVTLNLFERLQSGIKWVDFFHHLVVFWMIFFLPQMFNLMVGDGPHNLTCAFCVFEDWWLQSQATINEQ